MSLPKAVRVASGNGRACRSILPFGVSGITSKVTKVAGTM